MALVQAISIVSAVIRLHFLLRILIIPDKKLVKEGKRRNLFEPYSHPNASGLTQVFVIYEGLKVQVVNTHIKFLASSDGWGV